MFIDEKERYVIEWSRVFGQYAPILLAYMSFHGGSCGLKLGSLAPTVGHHIWEMVICTRCGSN